MSSDAPNEPPPSDVTSPKGGLYGGLFNASAVTDPNVRSVMMDYRWVTTLNGSTPATVISYAFPTQVTDYTDVPGGYPGAQFLATFRPATAEQKVAAVAAMGLVASYTKLAFVEAVSPKAVDATFRISGYGDGGSQAAFPANLGTYSPQDAREAGDQLLGTNGRPTTMQFYGLDQFNTIMHEMGHSFGLKHGHDPDYSGALAPNRNDNEFSVMTYASYFGADTEGATAAHDGSAPQGYMMYDIAALQAYYGANFDKLGVAVTYSWDPATGRQSIDGNPAPNTGVTATNKIFSTVWTQGAVSTFDLSAFSDNQVDDMRPGQWLTFSYAQLADLDRDSAAGSIQHRAQGNIYNALLYNGDTRSAIGNLFSGNGNDTIIGNELSNSIVANGGSDFVVGGAGNDLISGGTGADNLAGEAGADKLDGGADGDFLNGGDGIDFADYASSGAGLTVNLLAVAENTGDAAGDSFISIEGLIGSNLHDILRISNLAGSIWALGGNDRLFGGAGIDDLHGQDGNDHLIGGISGDLLDGGAGSDFADYSTAGKGVTADLLHPGGNTGDAAGDTYVGIEGIIGSELADVLLIGDAGGSIWALAGNDRLTGGNGIDDLHGQDGNDHLIGGPSGDVLEGGAGIDFADYSSAQGPVLANLLTPGDNVGDAAGDTYTSVEGLIGSNFDDALRIGNGGSSIWALGGNDTLFGGAGVDDLHGQTGFDHLIGGFLGDILDGGDQIDFASYATASAGVVASLLNPAGNTGDAAGDSYLSIEGLIGSEFNDQLSLHTVSGSIWALAGDDSLTGGALADDLHGQDGNDTVNGAAAGDMLEGGSGFDLFLFFFGEANGDTVLDFAGNGAGTGDTLQFSGFGTAAQGASFTQLDAARWNINSADGTAHETITFANAASIHLSDYLFV